MNWLIRNLVGYVVFAVIVLFQSDIRRALAHFGRAPFFRYFAKAESAEESIEELVVAASMLSAQRIGAIIAIERQIGLRNYIEGGIPLDAVLTYDLLLSIFQPASPLHDGAVIVQDDRVAAAACFLPLTVNPKLSKELGIAAPRGDRPHRGERRGGDRRVRGDRQHLDRRRRTDRARARRATQLRARLRSLVLQRRDEGAAEARGRSTRDARRRDPWPFRHFGLKVLSVGLAVLLWMVVSGEETVERGLRVPLELQQVPAGARAARRRADDGRRPRARRVRHAEPRRRRRHRRGARPAHGARRAAGCFRSTPEQVRVPFGVEVVQVTPSTVAMAFEPSAPRQVPVVPAVDGRPGARLRRRADDRRAADGRSHRARERRQARRPRR